MPESQIKPDFFIVGAGKSGTSAMREYLRAHPDIYIPEHPPEPSFFGSDLIWGSQTLKHRPKTLDRYLALFASWNGQKRIGEKSVVYLLSEQAASEIKAFSPDAQILMMLRNPVDQMYASYHQVLYLGAEDMPTFAKALTAEPDRKQGRKLPPRMYVLQGLLYHEAARFTQQVRRYFDTFGRERTRVIIYDDFQRDVSGVYRQTLEFLGLASDYQPEFRRVNVNRSVRNRTLAGILRTTPPSMLWVGKLLMPVARPISRTLKRMNVKQDARPRMNPEMRRQLQEEFLPEVERLSELLGRDLTYWCREEQS